MADTIINVDPRILKVHPRNSEFFDDVNGAEFDRLVESIKDHGVLTPLRVTKDMTIISGHQRMRAAIQAEIFSVPVIVDESEDDNDVLMKLIETNFGRMKNDPVKQAKWIKEYEELRGVRQGAAERNNFAQRETTQEDIANELGVTVKSLQNLKKLLKLDPALQAMISDGKINATTGFKILAKLTPEEQAKLVDKLPDDVKFSAKSIEAHIEEMRQSLVGNINSVKEENDKLMGENDRLAKEAEKLREEAKPVSDEAQRKINKLELDKKLIENERQKHYEEAQNLKDKVQALERENETIKKDNELMKAQRGCGPDAFQKYEKEIEELRRERNLYRNRSENASEVIYNNTKQIEELERKLNDNNMSKAMNLNETPDEMSQREKDELVSDIQVAIGMFQASIEGFLMNRDKMENVNKEILKVLVETCTQALTAGNRLKVALMRAGGIEEEENYPSYYQPTPYPVKDHLTDEDIEDMINSSLLD